MGEVGSDGMNSPSMATISSILLSLTAGFSLKLTLAVPSAAVWVETDAVIPMSIGSFPISLLSRPLTPVDTAEVDAAGAETPSSPSPTSTTRSWRNITAAA